MRIVDNLSSGKTVKIQGNLGAGWAVQEVLRYTDQKAQIELHPEMPTGPMNRVADNSLAKKLLGWEPQVKFIDGLHRTIDWYFANKDREQVKATLDRMLTER